MDTSPASKHRISRRHFLAAGGAGAASLIALGGSADAAPRPNVIVIMTDDQGYGDFSCHGHPILQTPHLDALHATSGRFTDFHVTPVCTPTRGQLMTGMDAFRNGACTVPAGHNIMRRELPMLPEAFRTNGYRTGLFGKWHLGDSYPDRPMDRGFERCIWLRGHGVQSSIEFDNDCVDTRYLDQLEVKQSKRYNTDLYFEEAMAWMDEKRRAGQPFFTYIATTAPHSPHWYMEKDIAPYRGKAPEPVAAFYALIANIDDNMGRLERWLKGTGLHQDTIVVFLTDNGGTQGSNIYNAGLRQGKGAHYDGGHRAACFVRWPGGNFGTPRDAAQPTQVQDLFPTLAALCGLTLPPSARFDGIALDAVLRDPAVQLPDRKMVVQFGGRIRPEKWGGCVIWGKWRLVGKDELYDIEEDRAQTNNVADAYPEVLAAMRAHYEQWWTEVSPIALAYQPLIVGSEHENPVLLTSNTWEGVDADNPSRVASATARDGGISRSLRGGPWNISPARVGTYEIELRRWPFHLDCPLDAAASDTTVAGRAIGLDIVVLPIAGAVLETAGQRYEVLTPSGALGAVFNVELPPGRTKLWGWFRDAQGADLCGAFYARVRRT